MSGENPLDDSSANPLPSADTSTRTDEECQKLFQQIYANSQTDVTTLFSTYQQLLSSATAASNSSAPAAAIKEQQMVNTSTSSDDSATDFSSTATSQPNLIPATVQDVSNMPPAKDAKVFFQWFLIVSLLPIYLTRKRKYEMEYIFGRRKGIFLFLVK